MRCMKILQIFAAIGFIIFFPIGIGDSTCLFGYFAGICFSTGNETSGAMLDNYMHIFAIPWWISIGLTIWIYKKQHKAKFKIDMEDRINA